MDYMRNQIDQFMRYLALEKGASADALVARAREAGLLFNETGASKVRLVTHLDVSQADCEKAVDIFSKLV